MSTCRRVLLAASLAAPLALASCGKKNTEPTQPPVTPVPAASADDSPAPAATPAPAVERMIISGSLEGLDDTMAAFKKFGESYMPDNATDPKSELQAMLLGMGFGPGFLGNVDLDGLHTFTSAAPVSGGRPEDTSLAVSVAVVDARKLIENMPQSQRPSPLGEGMWELAIDTIRLLMREQGKELLLGFSTEDIETARSLRASASPGARMRLRASNIPADDIDPSAVLDELPAGSPLVEELSEVLRELEALTFELDLGTERDFKTQLGAEAPFHKLGLEPIGTPRTAATSLESKLPDSPAFAVSLSWGDPALLHTMMDALPLRDLPDPINGMATKAVASAHTLLDQIARDVVVAVYLDKKGQGTVVLAADVEDDAKAKAALQGLHEVLDEGIRTQATMAGSNKGAAFSGKLQLNGLKVPGGKADRLSITASKDFQQEFRMAKMFMRKGSIDAISHVDQGVAIMAIGAGARAVVTDVAKGLGKARKSSLAQHPGLAGVRAAMGGCQICFAGDPRGYFRMRLLMLRDGSDEKDVAKETVLKLSALGKIPSIGMPGVGIKVEPQQAALGVSVPQTTMFAAPATVEKLKTIFSFINDPETAMAEAKASK